MHNAAAHRNYESANTPIRLIWFDNRVEIISPGTVYGEVTRSNFGRRGATAYRNPTLAEAMKNLGFMQRFGMGFEIVRQTLQQNGKWWARFTGGLRTLPKSC